MPRHAIPRASRARRVLSVLVGAVAVGLVVTLVAVTQPWAAPAATPTATHSPQPPVLASPLATPTTPSAPKPTPTVKPLSAPKDVAVGALTDGHAELTWRAVKGATRYLVRYSPNKSMKGAKSVKVKEPTATLGLPNNTLYYVQVAALSSIQGKLSPPLPVTVAPLVVGSFNIHCSSCHKSGSLSWPARRANVVRLINDESPDVLGLQEALTTRGQIFQLMASLGSKYALVAAPGVKDGTRIIYQPAKLRLVQSGVRMLPGGGFRRYANWAIFLQRSTGKKIFIMNAHLEPGKGQAGRRASQTRALLAETRAHRGGLPTYVVGDFNAFKFDGTGNQPYRMLTAAGYRDPLGNTYRSHAPSPSAFVAKRINTNFDTSNRFLASPPRKSYANGTHLDYILVTSGITIAEFEVVVRVNAQGRWTMRPIPSDHNMVRVTSFLP